MNRGGEKSDTRATIREGLTQLRDGLAAFGLLSHPREVSSMLLGQLPRHGMTPTSAIMGAALTWGNTVALVDSLGEITYRELGWATCRLASALDQYHTSNDHAQADGGEASREPLISGRSNRHSARSRGIYDCQMDSVRRIAPITSLNRLGHETSFKSLGSIACATSRRMTSCVGQRFPGDHDIADRPRLALLLPDTRHLLVALGAGCMTGASVALVNPRIGGDELRAYLAENDIETVIGADERSLPPNITHIPMSDLGKLIACATRPAVSKAKSSRYVMLTGGTTGAPVGIPIRRRVTAPLPAIALAGATQMRHGSPTLVCAPLFHGYGLATAMLALVAGSPMVLTSALRGPDMSRMNKGDLTSRIDWGKAIWSAMTAWDVGVVFGVPAHFRALAAYVSGPDFETQAAQPPRHPLAQARLGLSCRHPFVQSCSRRSRRRPSSRASGSPASSCMSDSPPSSCAQVAGSSTHADSGPCDCAQDDVRDDSSSRPGPTPALRRLVSGSDRLDTATVATLTDFFGPVVVNYYGTTESGTITMVQGQDVIDHPDSVGRPVIGNRVRIVNEDGSIVPRGTSGRIRLASPMASLSNNGPGRAYTTTDLGMLDEQGWLYHLGRADDRERIGGEFINPRRIEEVLTSINGVESAHVWTTETQKGLRVAGTVTVQPGADLSPKTIQAVVRTRLGPASVPVTIEIERPSEGCD